jgi:hypothetical protein
MCAVRFFILIRWPNVTPCVVALTRFDSRVLGRRIDCRRPRLINCRLASNSQIVQRTGGDRNAPPSSGRRTPDVSTVQRPTESIAQSGARPRCFRIKQSHTSQCIVRDKQSTVAPPCVRTGRHMQFAPFNTPTTGYCTSRRPGRSTPLDRSIVNVHRPSSTAAIAKCTVREMPLQLKPAAANTR